MHLTRLPLFLDSLCVADSFSPDRFDLQSSQAPYGLDLVARSVLLSSTARDVGALAPPARVRRHREVVALKISVKGWMPGGHVRCELERSSFTSSRLHRSIGWDSSSSMCA